MTISSKLLMRATSPVKAAPTVQFARLHVACRHLSGKSISSSSCTSHFQVSKKRNDVCGEMSCNCVQTSLARPKTRGNCCLDFELLGRSSSQRLDPISCTKTVFSCEWTGLPCPILPIDKNGPSRLMRLIACGIEAANGRRDSRTISCAERTNKLKGRSSSVAAAASAEVEFNSSQSSPSKFEKSSPSILTAAHLPSAANSPSCSFAFATPISGQFPFTSVTMSGSVKFITIAAVTFFNGKVLHAFAAAETCKSAVRLPNT
mmetsp:Transcript_53039/g.124289  ORF Transcript_53039/g.124289 Transcript_53039/m.124289 type:complete len:261 (-) Transcript_53039:150-932(-)